VLGPEKWITGTFHPYFKQPGPRSARSTRGPAEGAGDARLRVDRHCRNAARSPGFVESQKIERVLFPGLPSHPQYALAQKQMGGSATSSPYTVAGGKEGAFRFLDALRLVDPLEHLGDAKSLITHPGRTTHSRLTPASAPSSGSTRGWSRISVGLGGCRRCRRGLETALQAV